MKKIGVYKIETSFNITGRGIVALCQLIDGNVKIGSQTKVEFDGIEIAAKISGYEWGKSGGDGVIRYGLLLSFADDSLAKRIAAEKLKEQIIEIFHEG